MTPRSTQQTLAALDREVAHTLNFSKPSVIKPFLGVSVNPAVYALIRVDQYFFNVLYWVVTPG